MTESSPTYQLDSYNLNLRDYLSDFKFQIFLARILVGHKGTGKSALFKVAISEEKEKGHLPILVKPDDIAELGKSDENFLLRIRQWKWGLNKIIGEKVFNELGLYNDEVASKITKFGVKLTSLIFETVKSVKDKVTLLPAQKLLMENYLKTNKITVYIDDLDRGWEGKHDDIIRISALLNCIRDLANENERLFFKISLRSDVYFLVRTSDVWRELGSALDSGQG